MPDYPQTKQELLDRIREGRRRLEEVLSRLDPAELVQPGPDSGWSVKDHLAHLSEWRRKQLGLIDGLSGPDALGVDPELYNSGIDRLNEALYDRNSQTSLEDVLTDFRDTHEALLRRIEQMAEADLGRSNNLNDPEDLRTLVEGIASNTYEHDEEHAAWIEELY